MLYLSKYGCEDKGTNRHKALASIKRLMSTLVVLSCLVVWMSILIFVGTWTPKT